MKNIFSGRLTRGQHFRAVIGWLVIFYLGFFVTVVPIAWILKLLQIPQSVLDVIVILMFFGYFFYALVWIISIQVRRLHDLNRSGRDMIYMIVPIVNFFFAFMLWLIPGNDVENKYGKREDLNLLEIFRLKRFPKGNWYSLSLLSLVVISLAFLFYWFSIRPGMIKSSCADVPTLTTSGYSSQAYQQAVAAKYGTTSKPPFDPELFLAAETANPSGHRKATPGEYEYCLRKHGL